MWLACLGKIARHMFASLGKIQQRPVTKTASKKADTNYMKGPIVGVGKAILGPGKVRQANLLIELNVHVWGKITC